MLAVMTGQKVVLCDWDSHVVETYLDCRGALGSVTADDSENGTELTS